MKHAWTAAIAVALTATVGHAQTKEVTIAYQDMVVPYRMAQESKALEAATGYKINWKQFGGGLGRRAIGRGRLGGHCRCGVARRTVGAFLDPR